MGGALPDPPSLPPAATVLAESDASGPPHPARIEMAAKLRRTKTTTFFLIMFTCFFRILAAFNQRGLAFALRNGQAFVGRSLQFASSTGHTKGVTTNVARPAAARDWTCD
ncbi:MAG: hypothetical protein WBD10_05075 [Acidobacteriaceae bacterium]